MVSASFKANANGSFTSGLLLLSLEVKDCVTPDTFYPTICRNLQKAHSKLYESFNKDADLFYDAKERMAATMVTPLPGTLKPKTFSSIKASGLPIAALRE